MRERQDPSRTREAGNRDEVEGVVANTLKLYRNGAVGFIVWLDRFRVLLTANNHPTDDAESNEKSDLIKVNLLKPVRKWMEEEEQKPH